MNFINIYVFVINIVYWQNEFEILKQDIIREHNYV